MKVGIAEGGDRESHRGVARQVEDVGERHVVERTGARVVLLVVDEQHRSAVVVGGEPAAAGCVAVGGVAD